MAKQKLKWKEWKNVLSGDKTITVHKRRRLIMEGCRKIVFCDPEKMILEGDTHLEICGKKLVLKELGGDVIAVEGKLDSIAFGEREA